MHLSSMTGFTRNSYDFELNGRKISWSWEIKSVNGKNTDIKARLPQGLDDMESAVKNVISGSFARGTFTVTLDIQYEKDQSACHIDQELLANLLEKAGEIYEASPQLFSKPSPVEFFRLPGVLKANEDKPDEAETAVLREELLRTIKSAAEALKNDRCREGEKIGRALNAILEQISRVTEQAAQICAETPQKMRERIVKQLAELAHDSTIPAERLEQEALLLIMRADVREELDRLRAHIKNAAELLAQDQPVGRRLDFLCQELNREANTLCSKSFDIEQTRCGMELKALIEQFREQIQNVE